MATENFEGIQTAQQEENIDIKALFFKFVRYWYLFALTLFVTIVIAFLFNKYTAPVYEVKTTVLVKDDKSVMDPSSLIGIGLSNSAQNVENEIGKLISFSLTYRTVQALGFEVSYYKDEGLINTELYKDAPFEIVSPSTGRIFRKDRGSAAFSRTPVDSGPCNSPCASRNGRIYSPMALLAAPWAASEQAIEERER